MATVYKIHPAIGIARLGNSPDEFFIGPERRRELPMPDGGFKDGQCRVKRQAARFRIFAHHDDGSVAEITDSEAEITWTVWIANKKADFAGRGNTEPPADLAIDPGARTLNSPNQRELFDNGRIQFAGQSPTVVPLGEIRSDDAGRLIVLGGAGTSASPGGNGIGDFWGNAGWYDDVSDGPVSATIQLRADGGTPAVTGAWVIVAPPKFAPHQDSVTTLYDRILDTMIAAGLSAAPTSTSYTEDVYPILQRARDIKWVYETRAHTWPDPVLDPARRNAIFNRLSPPGGASPDMPALNGDNAALTATQYAHMQRWKDDVNFVDDWAGVPGAQADVTPEGLDRAALEACVGGSFFPGIEAGGLDDTQRPITTASNYASAFRIDHGVVGPGGISAAMALPWQADFLACADNWWPVPRPNDVVPQGSSAYVRWDRDITSYEEMVADWHKLGFVLRQGDQHVEVDRCGSASIVLLTPSLHFADVPQGPLGMVREQPLAIVFEVIATGAAVTLEYAPGGAPNHPQLVAANRSVTVAETAPNAVATARFFIVYRTGTAPSAIATQFVTVREPVSGQQWTISIDANTVGRKKAAVALVLDRSGSMAEDRGDGVSKHVSLQQAAETFVATMLEEDGVGLVRYDQDAQPVAPVRALGSGGISDLNRNDTIDLIRGPSFAPAGATSIGDGLFEGRTLLDAVGGYAVKALVVLTDGNENRARFIADVAESIDAQTYAIGLGQPQNVSAPALQALSGNRGGFLLVTGAIDAANRFLLQKHFLQILAGVSNAEVVLDPDGELRPGVVHRIPFLLSDADAGLDVILLSPGVKAIDFRLQTPKGFVLEPWRARAEPAMRYVLERQVSYFRLALPAQLIADRYDQEGTWHVLLTLGHPRLEPTAGSSQRVDRSILRGLHASPGAQRGAVHERRPNERQRRFEVAQRSAPLETGSTETVSNQAASRAVPYSVVVHSYSSLSLRASVRQSGFQPGAMIHLQAQLSQSGVAMEDAAAVWVELIHPDAAQTRLDLTPGQSGQYLGEFAALLPGVYRLRVRARGRTRKGLPFVRERTLSAAVWHGADHPPPPPPAAERHDELCSLLRCLLRRGGPIDAKLEKRLHEEGLDLREVRACLDRACEPETQATHDP